MSYEPGVCNINPQEATRRRRGGQVALAVSGAALATELALKAPWWSGLILSAPIAGAATGFLQSRDQFCVAHAVAGTQLADAEIAKIEDGQARAADRAKARRMGAKAAAIGLAGGAAASATLLARRY